MEFARATVASFAVAIMAAGAVVTGCGDGKSSPSSSEASSSPGEPPSGSSSAASPSPGQSADYSALLIKASDVGADVTTPQPPVLNPGDHIGVAQLYVSPDGSHRLGDTILIVEDPVRAAIVLENTKANYAGRITGTWQPADVGSNGAIISGMTPDNALAVTVLLFTVGRAVVNMEFDSAPKSPMDVNAAIAIGRKQDAAIRSGLPG